MKSRASSKTAAPAPKPTGYDVSVVGSYPAKQYSKVKEAMIARVGRRYVYDGSGTGVGPKAVREHFWFPDTPRQGKNLHAALRKAGFKSQLNIEPVFGEPAAPPTRLEKLATTATKVARRAVPFGPVGYGILAIKNAAENYNDRRAKGGDRVDALVQSAVDVAKSALMPFALAGTANALANRKLMTPIGVVRYMGTVGVAIHVGSAAIKGAGEDASRLRGAVRGAAKSIDPTGPIGMMVGIGDGRGVVERGIDKAFGRATPPSSSPIKASTGYKDSWTVTRGGTTYTATRRDMSVRTRAE